MQKSLFFSTLITFTLYSILWPIISQLTSYLHPIVIGTVLLCLLALITFLILLFRNEVISIRYNTFILILSFYTIILVILLFFRPQNQHYVSYYNLIPFSTVTFYFSGKVDFLISFYNLAANIILFIPYGIYLMVKKRKTTAAGYTFIPFIWIAAIELLQFFTHRGSLDVDDLILNVSGVYLGYLCTPIFKRVIHFS